jgi:Tol biopolymer transport system component
MRRSFVLSASAALVLIVSAAPARATFPGENGRIAFALDRGSGAEIYTMRPTGADRRRLTDKDRSAWFPSWSPDGTRIAFEPRLPRRGLRLD